LVGPLFRPTLEPLEDRTTPATITVTGTGDTIAVDGLVTLREAIQSINQGASVNSDVAAHVTGTYGTGDTIVFNIPGTGVHTINITGSPLPTVTRPVVIDGTTQATNSGDNPPQVGTGGTVGVGPDGIAGTGDELVLPTVTRPDIEIRGTNAIGSGLTIGANNVVVRGLAIYGFGTANINIAQNSNNPLIEQNVLGTTASSFTDPGTGVRSGGANILVPSGGTNNGIIRNNLIGFSGGSGIDMRGGAATYQITGNEVRSNGLTAPNGAGIDLSGQNTVNTTVRGNLIVDNRGFGINLFVSNGNSTVDQNTVTGNGVGGAQTAGIAIGVANNKVSNNIITANYGAGVLVGASALGNPITKNSIFANGTILSASGAAATGEIGIDLLTPSDNQNTGTSPFVTPNRPNGQNQAGGNGLLNFPVLTTATQTGSNLELDGFARPGSVIELFIPDPDPTGFGEGKTYLVTLTEGSAQDLDSGTGSYGPGPINGLNQGSDTTNRFRFLVPLASLPLPVGTGTVLSATATLANSTSEFSGNVTVGGSPQADLAVTKTVDDPAPNVGQNVSFAVTVINKGSAAATGVTLVDQLPSGLMFVSSSAPAAYNPTTGIWTVGALANGGSATLTVTATVNGPAAQLNTASINHSDQTDPDPGNNSASALVTPQQSDLVVGKLVSDPTPNVNETITYKVTVGNDGPNAATGVALQDVLPGEVSYQSSTATQGSYDPATHTWTVGTVAVGATQTLTITAVVISPAPSTNTASISAADQFDPDTANNSDGASVVPQQADLELTKTVSDPSPNVGDTVTFTVTLTNNGFSTATNVTVADSLPSGLSFVSATPSQGTYVGGVWTVGTVAASATPTLTITATVVSPGAETNMATVSHSDQFDPDPGNDTASATVTPQRADLELTKTVSNATPNVDDTITYTIAVNDKGPDPATGVVVNDVLPTGLILLSATPSRGTYAGGVWTVGTVDPSTAQTLLLTVRVNGPNSKTNTATIAHSDQFDPDTANNSDSASIVPQQADLVLTKSVSNSTPDAGAFVTFTVTLTDNGPDTATNVTVTDLLPGGLTFVAAAPSQGTYNPTTGLWTVGTVTTTAPQRLTLTAAVVGPGAITNTATISRSDQYDPNTPNNTARATVTPALPTSSLAGSVYFDTNGNGMRDPGEMGVPGVTVTLTVADPVSATVVTDGNGDYRFLNMFPGTYTLTETQPPNLIDGRDRMGTLGGVPGNDIITNIPVGVRQAGTLYEFGELGLIDPSKYWLLSNTDLSQLFGPPGSGVTDVNPGLFDPPTGASAGATDPLPALLVTQSAGGSLVQVFGAGARTPHVTLDPFPGYGGRLAVATADLYGTGPDVIVATAEGSSHVAVFDALTGGLLQSFMAFDGFNGGLSLAVGDVTGAGYPDIIVGTATGSSHVKVFDGRTGALAQSYLAFPGYDGGVQVSAGDATGTGRADLAVAPLHGSSHVKVFDGQTGATLASFMALPGFTGDISLVYVPVNGVLSVLYAGTATGGSQVEALGADGSVLESFVAYPGFSGGVHLAAGDTTGTGSGELLTLAVGTDHEKVFANDGSVLESFMAPAGTGVDLNDSLLWFARQHQP
jgi:uncharacterized repeat protein (TIGR01451 family)